MHVLNIWFGLLLSSSIESSFGKAPSVQICAVEQSKLEITPFSYSRQHLSYDGGLEVRGEMIRTILCCTVY